MNQSDLDAVIAKVAAYDVIPATLASDLKQEWPEIHFTVCMDDDVCNNPVIHENENFNVYLVSGADHCISFTSSLERATGIVIAEFDDLEF